MIVTITGINNFLNDTKILEGVNWDDCTFQDDETGRLLLRYRKDEIQ